jgi:hypothetical protein
VKEALQASIERLDVLLQIFAFIVAVGVLGEAGFGVRHVLLSRRLRMLQKAEDLQLRIPSPKVISLECDEKRYRNEPLVRNECPEIRLDEPHYRGGHGPPARRRPDLQHL